MERPANADQRPRLRLGMLSDAYELALEAAGVVWPTPALALGSLFERGTQLLERGGELDPIPGAGGLVDELNRSRDELFVLEAQSAITSYVVFVLTGAGEALEATWLALADQHLLIRAEIVACRRDEERLKRELAALGVATVALPEHEDLPAPSADRPRKSQGMYAHLFEGLTEVVVEPQVAPAMLARADQILERRGWTSEWGEHARLAILAYGLSLALREREADTVDPDDPASIQAARARTRERTMRLEGRYATLRFRLFELRHNNQILKWRITALEIEARGMGNRLELFRRDRARLEEELAARRAALPERAPAPDAGHPTGWRARLARLFGAGES